MKRSALPPRRLTRQSRDTFAALTRTVAKLAPFRAHHAHFAL